VVDIVHKPTALATQQLYDLRDELVQKVRTAAAARSPRPLKPITAEPPPRQARRHEVIVIGTSTGGPQAITRLLMGMPADLPCPIAIALHIPAGYTEALAARLDAASAIEVREAAHGMELGPGQAVIAPGGAHLRLVRRGRRTVAEVDYRQGDALHAPSVDLLFVSAAESFGAATLGVVLTGMGDDGLKGSAAIQRAGGIVLTESDLSCVVYGMPRAVKEAGLSHAEAPLEAMVTSILRHL
jgi:two-component system chemotaxis response regulator CheB